MEKMDTNKLKVRILRTFLDIADYFSDFKNSKSIPFTTYEVEIPEMLRDKKHDNDI